MPVIDNPCELVHPDIWAILTILQESRNQTFDGMLGVAEVIRNRTKSKFYSDGSIISTILMPKQFSGWNTNDPNRIICGKLKTDNEHVILATKAWKIANENNTDLTSGAFFYHAKTMKVYPEWSKSPKIARTTIIGDHIFYKKVS